MNNHDIVTKITLIAKVVQSGLKKSIMVRPQNSVCLFIGGYSVCSSYSYREAQS